MARLRRGHLLLLLVAALAVAAVAAFFMYTGRGAAPAAAPAAATTPTPQPSSSSSSTANVASSVEGAWHVGPGSTVGYRVRVTALGWPTTVKAQTPHVWGTVTVAAGDVTHCSLTVDMTGYAGTQLERSAIGAGSFPTARFVLTRPVALTLSDSSSAAGAVSYPATGRLVLHGRSLPLDFTLSCVHAASSFTVRARVPIAFARWHLPVPAGFTCRGDVEIVLHLVRGAGNAPTVTTS